MTDPTTDVLRLSRGMTYKSALANLPLGGGKAVIIGNPQSDKTEDLLLSMADFINSLEGLYVSAEDSGTSVADMKVMATRTQWVAGIAEESAHGGDPSPSTAYGTFVGLQQAVKQRLGTADLSGLRVAIQGVGNVGYHLAKLLSDAGAELFVSDLQPTNIERVLSSVEAQVVAPEVIHALDVDVFSPCAMGSALNDHSVTELTAPVIAGAANNQLQSPKQGFDLHARGILYAPDFALNAGGIIDIAYRSRNATEAELRSHIEGIATTINEIFERSVADDLAPHVVANQLAEERFG